MSKDKLEAYLRESKVPFEVHHHPLAYTAQSVAESEHVPGKMVCKVVVALADGKMVMLALPAPYRVDLGKAAEALAAKDLRLAHEDEFAATFPDCDVGAMPPFGQMYNVPVYVDKTLTEDDRIMFQACTHTDTIAMAYADYERLAKPRVVDIAFRPAAARA